MAAASSIFLVYFVMNVVKFLPESFRLLNNSGFYRYEYAINPLIHQLRQRSTGKIYQSYIIYIKKMFILCLFLGLSGLILYAVRSALILNFIINSLMLFYGCAYVPKVEILPALAHEKAAEIFSRPLSQNFTVFFWFAIAGGFGVLLYDIVRRMEWQTFKNTMEFPAARALGAGYALSGHSMAAFFYQARHFFSGKTSSAEYLENCGFLALHGKLLQDIDQTELSLALARALVRRAGIILFLLFAVFPVHMI